MKRITIQDIAEELNLCRNTVAKALSGGAVSYETQREVIQKAYEMGYAKLNPKLIEEIEVKRQESNRGIIMVLFNRTESLFWNQILTGISDEIKENGYRMQLHIVDDEDVEGKETLKLIEPDVKGILFLCGFSHMFICKLSEAKLPMTFFNAPVEAEEYLKYGNVVCLEGRYAIKRLTQKVIDGGKRKFAFIGSTTGSINIKQRLDGMLQALAENGIEQDDNMLFCENRKDCYYSYNTVEEVIQNMPYMPEVFVCANDDIAKYAATALFKIDMQLARKTVIIGFDNTIEEEFFKQDILTVNIRKEEVGRRLIRTIMDQIDNSDLDNAIITVSTYPIFKEIEK